MDYVSEAGTNQVKRWSKKTLTDQERSDMETLLSVLAKQKQWQMPDFKTLSNMQGLGEIRWRSPQRTPLRLIGMRGEGAQYILLIGCSHKGTVYTPADALETALKRKRSLANGTGSICEHEEDDGTTEEEQAQ